MADTEDINVAEVRRWAKTEGFDVPARGTLKQDIIDAYRNRTQPTNDRTDADDDNDVPAPTTAKQDDETRVNDAVTITIESTSDSVAPAKDEANDDDAADQWMRRYRAARGIPNTASDADVAMNAKLLRNRVSLQTLENGFIHYQRATGADEVQARLVAAGFLNGYASGQVDENTVQAYARFQDSLGLPGTGIPERTSLEALDFDVIE